MGAENRIQYVRPTDVLSQLKIGKQNRYYDYIFPFVGTLLFARYFNDFIKTTFRCPRLLSALDLCCRTLFS